MLHTSSCRDFCKVLRIVLATQLLFTAQAHLCPLQAGESALTIKVGAGATAQERRIVPGRGEVFSDCATCPQMVVAPGSRNGVSIGSPESEVGRAGSEQIRNVDLRPFAIGRHEVSVAEYTRCVEAKACREPEWREPGGEHNIETGKGVTYRSIAQYLTGDAQPIVGISWIDAAAYADWLSRETGHAYRLPSEAEWEYAARAGSQSPFWWGNEPSRDGKVMACCRGCGSERDGSGLFAVDSFESNPWGLKNVHGNVWEWVADYFCETPEGAPGDGSARLDKRCSTQSSPEGLKVFRGGSCFYEPRQMRAAMRLRNWPDFRNMTIGFRVARSLAH